jgi:glycosyltransferase involved in cell wall biosynthesis
VEDVRRCGRGLEQRVRLVGERPHAEIPLWLGAADVFCLATRSEGWSNVLLEAVACGTPVVATRVGGNHEIVTHDGLGLLVDPRDDDALRAGILEALARAWDRDALAAHARAHSWEATSEAVVDEWHAMARSGMATPAPNRIVSDTERRSSPGASRNT